jgi:hypothetical protein
MAKTYDDDVEEQFGGFGREAVEEAAKRPTYASTQGQVGERERREAAVAGPLKKPAVVTKEQMKKEGYDNLRDYLNFKQNKTRRDSKPVETSKTDTAKAPVKKDEPPKVRKPGRSAVANRKRGKPQAESTPVKVAPGATAVDVCVCVICKKKCTVAWSLQLLNELMGVLKKVKPEGRWCNHV